MAEKVKTQICWNCKHAIHRDGSVTCIPLSRLSKKPVYLPKNSTADNCRYFEPRPKGYKLPQNFSLLFY